MSLLNGSTPLSTNDQDIINRHLDIDISQPHLENIEEIYEIKETVNKIISGNFSRIALQFPDELLSLSTSIITALSSHLPNRNIFILADTAYGSCCVDTIAAQHAHSDVIIHYGRTCLSPTTGIPVIYVFGKFYVDSNHAIESLENLLNQNSSNLSKILLLYDVMYHHKSQEIANQLKSKGYIVCLSTIDTEINMKCDGNKNIQPKVTTDNFQVTTDNFQFDIEDISDDTNIKYAPPLQPGQEINENVQITSGRSYTISKGHLSEYDIFYIGSENLTLKNIIMTHSKNKIYSYDPELKSARQEDFQTNRILMRRYVFVQKAKDSNIFGILVGTLGTANYLSILKRLEFIIKKSGRKSYTIVVGKLNPAKLANFAEIECWVLVTCEENSLVENKDFYKPIVTPFELEIALSDLPWGLNYITNYQDILKTEINMNEKEDQDEPHYSFITKKLQFTRLYDQRGESKESKEESKEEIFSDVNSVIQRNTQNALTSIQGKSMASAQFLHSREYKGLEEIKDDLLPSVLEQGRSGLAKGYNHPTQNSNR